MLQFEIYLHCKYSIDKFSRNITRKKKKKILGVNLNT